MNEAYELRRQGRSNVIVNEERRNGKWMRGVF
ncbi:hypothetical protein MCHLDSM_03508 [Mycolicibacterium chlorophenolicum]|uniref:Uncharacterized protein n=1 Tax=Mycolicibacterium chlorophenolicum TaxID=37916 RepID=A0A0J6VYT5_9MYCO|nr:hypothetical protein MCHLDSM_03508 [Mycolicibacterium chlorophenolicum]